MELMRPADIEKRSFEIITEELKGRYIEPEIEFVLKRMIHTTADFDFADTVRFSSGAVSYGVELIKKGCTIVTDTRMAFSGINKTVLEKHGSNVFCFMADSDVAEKAKAEGVTRAAVSMEKASMIDGDVIFAIGNAPTALIKLNELIKLGKIRPGIIIAVPVGFVNVAESKELIMESGIPYITAIGRKGGSSVAAAIVNAIIYEAFPREGV